MYRLSPYRLEYGHECTLVTAQQIQMIEQMKIQQARGLITHNQLPKFIYLIEHIVMFEYGETQHLIIAFENKSVQIFEIDSVGTGTCCFELNFSEDFIRQSRVQ